MDQLEPKKFRLPSRNGFFKSVVDDDDEDEDDDDGNDIINSYGSRKNAYQKKKTKEKESHWIEKEISETNSIFGSIGTLNSLSGRKEVYSTVHTA